MVVHALSFIIDDLARIRKRSFLSFRRKPESRNTKTSGPRRPCPGESREPGWRFGGLFTGPSSLN